jgi:hypothetical protein
MTKPSELTEITVANIDDDADLTFAALVGHEKNGQSNISIKPRDLYKAAQLGHGAFIYKSSTQVSTSNTWIEQVWGSTRFDTTPALVNPDNSGFLIPTGLAGFWFIYACVAFSNVNQDRVHGRILVNGGNYGHWYEGYYSASGPLEKSCPPVAMTVYLPEGADITYQTYSTNGNSTIQSGVWSQFSIARLG